MAVHMAAIDVLSQLTLAILGLLAVAVIVGFCEAIRISLTADRTRADDEAKATIN
jgi:hypothetical protein